MKIETIGAFEAKTHFSRLLREVSEGKEFHITLKGKPAAVIKKDNARPAEGALRGLSNLSKYRRSVSGEELHSFRDEGRER